MSILIVDDSEEIRQLLQMVLQKAGYGPIITAESGRQALEILGVMGRQIAPCDPDVILMDLMMPDIDGLEACRQIRSLERLEHTPIIIITAKTDTADLQAAYTAGATDFLRKPITPVELVARVSTALSLKQELDARITREQELIARTEELERALKELKSLRGLIAICAKCKRVRSDGTYRKRIEDYLEQCFERKLERDICPDCMEQSYPKAG
ncbi:MAG: response regulator [Nitrospira sp.]|nr:MAG: response regulator [Nitrospira sp.]